MSTTHTPTAAEVIEHVDPLPLHLGENVRREAQVDPELVAKHRRRWRA